MSCSTSSITLLEQTRLSKLWSRWATAEWDILWSVEAVHVITAVRQITRLSFTGWTMCKQAENHEAGCSSRWSDSAVSHRDPKVAVGPRACCSYLFWSFRKNTLLKKKSHFCLIAHVCFQRSEHQDWGVWRSKSTNAGMAVSQSAGSGPAHELFAGSLQQGVYVSFLCSEPSR